MSKNIEMFMYHPNDGDISEEQCSNLDERTNKMISKFQREKFGKRGKIISKSFLTW